MNRSISSNTIILTLFMLLLVLGAAFFFLFQGRQVLEDKTAVLSEQVNTLENDGTRIAAEKATVEGVRDQTMHSFATVAAEKTNLESDLAIAEQEKSGLQADVDTLTADLTKAEATVTAQAIDKQALDALPPEVAILSPVEGVAINVNEAVDLVVVATDAKGVTAVNLTIGDETSRSYPADDQTMMTVQDSWMPSISGPVIISAMAINTRGSASTPITVTIQVNGISPQIPQDPSAELRTAVEQNVVTIRGLKPQEPIVPTMLTDDELRQRIETNFAEDTTPEESRYDAIALAAFDFVPREFDLYNAMIDLYSEQIAGFYDPETDEFVVISDDDELDIMELWTHAHEFTHALQDQYFDLERLDGDKMDAEAQLAFRSLAEGEATLVQVRYLQDGYFDANEIEAIMASLMAESEAMVVTDSLPPVFINSLAFPYDAGFEFVLDLYNGGNMLADGDFSDINAAWENPPQSSEQILHPEQYRLGDVPQIVTLPPLTDTLGTGWQLIDEDVFGEFYLREYLSQQLAAAPVDTAATGWGGDRYAVYWNEADAGLVMVMRLVWDSSQDVTEFTAVYPRYLSQLYGVDTIPQEDGTLCWEGTDTTCFIQQDEGHFIARAPNLATAVGLLNAIQNNQSP